MRLLSCLIIAGAVTLGGCQTTGRDGIPSNLPESSIERFKDYQGFPHFKAFALAEHMRQPHKWGWTHSCAGRPSAKKAVKCAVKNCEKNKNASEHAASYFICSPYMIGDHLVYGKSRDEMFAIAEKYDQAMKAKAQAGADVAEPVKAVSLDEAKVIAAEFEQKTFVAPPRSIEDITVILDKQKIRDPDALSRWIETANKPTPKNASARQLTGFYFKRAGAAAKLGLITQAIQDYRLSLKYLEQLGGSGPRAIRIHRAAGSVEMGMGNYRRAIEIFRKMLDISSDGEIAKFLAQSKLLSAYLKLGDFEMAQQIKREGEIYTTGLLTDSSFLSGKAYYKPLLLRERAMMEVDFLKAQGHYKQAEQHIKAFIRHHRELMAVSPDAPTHQPLMWKGKLAKNLMKQGKLLQAEVAAREALIGMLQQSGKYNHRSAKLVFDLASILGPQGRNEEALRLKEAAIEILRAIKMPEQSSLLGHIRFARAKSLGWTGRWQEAAKEFASVRRDLGNHQERVEDWTRNSAIYYLTLIRTGQAKAAVTALQSALKIDRLQMSHKKRRLAVRQALLAMALAAEGQRADALHHFLQAMPVLVDRQNRSGPPTPNQNRQLDILIDAYLSLLTDRAQLNKQQIATDTFHLADIARGQSVQGALAASGIRAAAGNPELADLVRRLQDTNRQQEAVSELLGTVLSVPTDQQDPKAVSGLRANLNRLQSASKALRREIDTRFPEYTELTRPKPLTAIDARIHLHPGEALVSFYAGENKTYVWVVPKAGPLAFHVVGLGRSDLQDMVRTLRSSLDPGAIASLGDIPAFDVAAAHDLYGKLLQPVEAAWLNAKSLLIVADGALGQLPFSLLPVKPVKLKRDNRLLFEGYKAVPWLAKTHSVTLLPSVASLKSLRGTRVAAGPRRPFAGFGDPYFNRPQFLSARKTLQPFEVAAGPVQTASLRSKPATRTAGSVTIENLPRLPDTRTEIEDIAHALKADPNRDIFLGEKASEDTVKSMDLSPYRVISFATHGLVPGDLNGLSQPALALSAPSVTRGKEDGLLTMGEILGLKLNADWAVLSACNTAAADGKGAEAISGLGRAFFYAGARALLVSNWPVHSGATTDLMTTLFNLQARNPGLSRAESLRRTRLHMIEKGSARVDGKTAFSYAHPIFWAPFTLVGDGGGAQSGS